MNKIVLIAVSLILTFFIVIFSLGGFDEQPKPVVKSNFKFESFVGNIAVEEDPNLPTLGRYQKVGGMHFIKLRKYPICLLHETRHAIEGDWHKGVESDEDCYVHE